MRLAHELGYRGAGTIEFLVDDDRFYFLEMNARIQVEHPVTKMILGVDLVREQLLIAGGQHVGEGLDARLPRGHAFECRINAEDPAHDFFPSAGTLRRIDIPWRPGLRLDTGYEPGDSIPPQYDSLMAKLIVWGPDRPAALRRLQAVLAEPRIEGIATTLPALAAVAAHPTFTAGRIHTGWFASEVAP